MAGNSMPCLGRQDERCLCDMCLDRKVQLLRQAPPDVQRSILMHLPPDDLDTVPPAVSFSFNILDAFLGEAEPTNPNASSSGSGARTSFGDGAAGLPSPGPRQLHTLSLFRVPLWPTSADAQFDDAQSPPRNPPSRFCDIVIPPLVQQRIPTIKECVDYVIANASITGPRKEAAIAEAIDEVLGICERQLMAGR